MTRRTFGSIEKRPTTSGKVRYRARYQVADNRWVSAPTTFGTKGEAEAWLNRERVKVEEELAGSPRAKARKHRERPTLGEYAAEWLEERQRLRPSTRRTYAGYLTGHVDGTELAAMRLGEITPDDVRAWHKTLDPEHPTGRARVYALVKTIMKTAVDNDLIEANPCRIVGASQARAVARVEVLSEAQVNALTGELDEPDALAALLGLYGQLRIGEVLALRRRAITTTGLKITDNATAVAGEMRIGPPKTDAGVRDVALPAFLRTRLDAYVSTLPAGRDRLLFEDLRRPRHPLKTQTLADRIHRAAVRADLPAAFRFHHLRHTGLTWLAERGASVAELQARAGHSTPSMALRYQHARAERDQALAALLDEPVRSGAER